MADFAADFNSAMASDQPVVAACGLQVSMLSMYITL